MSGPPGPGQMSTGGTKGEAEATGPAECGEVQECRPSLSALADTEDPSPSWESWPIEGTGPRVHQAALLPWPSCTAVLTRWQFSGPTSCSKDTLIVSFLAPKPLEGTVHAHCLRSCPPSLSHLSMSPPPLTAPSWAARI